MGDTVFERLAESELPAFREFCEQHWGSRHALIHDEVMFDYYYRRGEALNFIVAKDEQTSELFGVCGFIAASQAAGPDVWISFILSKKGAPFGVGFGLLDAVAKTTNCRTLGCNNIRRETSGLYEFMGYTVAPAEQYYRFNPDIENYTLCNIVYNIQLPVNQTNISVSPASPESLADFPFSRFAENRPFKDANYVRWRYFDNPWLDYDVFLLKDAGERALLVSRTIEHGGACALRVVDFIGDRALVAKSGAFLDDRMRALGAEFVDWYVYGEQAAPLMRAAGLAPVGFSDKLFNTIPSYLDPPKMENTRFYVFVSDPDGYWMNKADGEGDRPRIEL